MQAHLADLASDPTSPNFRTCQRVYNRCQRILFEDPEASAPVPRRRLANFLPFFEANRKVYPDNAMSAMVGLSSALISVGCPVASDYCGSLALQQGRRPPGGMTLERGEIQRLPSAPLSVPAIQVDVDPMDGRPAADTPKAPAQENNTPPSVAKEPGPTQDTKEDPIQHVFGEEEWSRAPSKGQESTTFTSEPSTSQPPSRAPTPAPTPLDTTSREYELRQKYLFAHYGRSEMQFLQTLQDIPTRLQQLPKQARLSALRAELTALNQTLPSEVCFPTWCAGLATDATHRGRHHRVVRISASEAVVLNSADRVPYLLHVEVLRNDLDFDPNRKYNRELLQRILGKHEGSLKPLLIAQAKRASIPCEANTPRSATPESLHSGEVDLTEQMYGADLAAFGREQKADESDQDILVGKNDTLDMAAWAHATPTEPRAGFSLEEYAQRMRTAAVMLAQLNKSGAMTRSATADAQDAGAETMATHISSADAKVIRQRIMDEMAALEEQRMDRMKRGGQYFGRLKRNPMGAEDESAVLKAVNKDDPSAAYFRESWTVKKERIRASSPYGNLPAWDLFSVIVKTGADLRQEQFAVQLIKEFKRVWNDCQSRCWVHYFRIVVLNENAGLIETIKDAISVHSIKKEAYARQLDGQPIATFSLYDHFLQTYGEPQSPNFRRAQRHFIESLAGYAIVSYLLQIKDRHNGNILVDTDGHLVHIDFGFMLGLSPGGVGFEAAPFKFPRDYIEILGGMDSEGYEEFRQTMRQGFRDVRRHAERFILLVELMERGMYKDTYMLDSYLPCFTTGDSAAAALRDRFQLGLTPAQCDEFVDKLILSSAGSAFTRLYDQYQNFTQNIL